MHIRKTTLGVLIAAALPAPASAESYKLTAADTDLFGRVWTPKHRDDLRLPCGFLRELMSRVSVIGEAAARNESERVGFQVQSVGAATVVAVCANPSYSLEQIEKFADLIRKTAPAAIAPYYNGLKDFVLRLEPLFQRRDSILHHREFAKWARTMLQPCLGEKVLASVVSSTVCGAPVLSRNQSYAQAISLVGSATNCANKVEEPLLASRMSGLNDLAKKTASCARKAAKNKTVADICADHPWFQGNAPSICRLAVGKKP
ncbi:MAG: hypothetical protein HYY84_20920 [Deltaproteobacteria bacterium]|nr:hypothetical protein [Deltaproteobacteria bacterium]